MVWIVFFSSFFPRFGRCESRRDRRRKKQQQRGLVTSSKQLRKRHRFVFTNINLIESRFLRGANDRERKKEQVLDYLTPVRDVEFSREQMKRYVESFS